MGFLSFVVVFVSGAIFGTAALVVGLIFAFNVGADSLDRGREKAAEKRKKFTHLDAKKWLPKPRAVQVVAALATRSRDRAASVSSSTQTQALVLAQPPQPLLRKLVVDLIESTNLPIGTSSSIDAVVRIRLGEQRTKSRTLLKCSGSAKWNQTFVLRVDNPMTESLELSLCDENNELCICTISLRELLRDQPKAIKQLWLMKAKGPDAPAPIETSSEVKLSLTILDWESDVPLTKVDIKKAASNKLKDAADTEERADVSSTERDASDSAGHEDSLEQSTAMSEDASEDPGNISPPLSPIKRSTSAPLGGGMDLRDSEITVRTVSDITSSLSGRSGGLSDSAPGKSSSISSSNILSPTPRRGSVSIVQSGLLGNAASTFATAAPMYKVLRIVGKKGAVKEIGIQGWMSAKWLKKSKNYEKCWIVLDGDELRVYETSEQSTFLGSFKLEKAKIHKSRTKKHHMTIEINKNVWTDHVHKLEDSPNAALMARHPAINAAQSAGLSIKDAPHISMKAIDDSITPWVEQCKLASVLNAQDLAHWFDSGQTGEVTASVDDLTDMTTSDDESAQTNTVSDSATEESTSATAVGLGDAVASLASSDKKTKKSRRTLSKDNDEKKRQGLLGSAAAVGDVKRLSLPLSQSVKGLDLTSTLESSASGPNLRESLAAPSARRGRAASVAASSGIPELPLRASSPELSVPSEKSKDGQVSPNRNSLLASSRSNTVVPSGSSSSSSSSLQAPQLDAEDAEIDYVTKELDKEIKQKMEGEIPPLHRIPSSIEPVNAAFLNALLRRVFLDMSTSTLFSAEVRRKIEKKFREIKRPPFLGPLELSELNWGISPPQFDELKVHQPEKSNEVLIEADVRYEGGVSATLQTTVYINFPRPMSAVIPIKAFVTVSSLRGKLHLMMPSEANARFELCLVESPVVDMNVHVDFGKGTRVSSLPKLKKFLFSAGRKAIDHLLVYPSKLTFFFPLPGRKPDPEVVTPKDAASVRNPTQGTTGSKGSALGSSPDNDDANACRFVALEFIDRVLNNAKYDMVSSLVAEDAILFGGQILDVPWQGRDAITTWVQLLRHAFPDLFFYVEDCLMNGAIVTVRWIARGTFKGPLWDYPPTGDELVLRGMFMFKVKDGNQKIAELYSFWSLGSLYGMV